ncbi:hypothetical protein GQ44DRAFT_249388 [Phaeosphaeriaceae sp. PMI808]|nr:hypothetical protein GQ44DRAFT_249388 [Phaeosphaeriaceae sp. PMI808]
MTLPLSFQQSYKGLLSYPENLISSGTAIYRSKLKSYRAQLKDAASKLCLVDETDDVASIFEIPIIDLDTWNKKALQKQYIHSPAKLTKWLGAELVDDAESLDSQHVIAKKRDPKCRFIYLYGQNSRDKLKITHSSLTQILTYHQVMPAYLDFMLVFGAQSDPRDLRFSGFREHVRLKAPTPELSIPSLGRSGRQYQLCYNLKSVQFKKKNDENIKFNEWSIRQTAVHHQFDVELGTTLWIVTKGGVDLLDQFEEMTGPDGRPEDKRFGTPGLCFASSLSMHLMFCHWSTGGWRWYIQWLEEVLDHESGMAIHGPRGEGFAHMEYKPYHIQDLQHWQDRANEAVMVLEANTDVLMSIHKFYHNLVDRKDFPDMLKAECEDDLHTFTSQLDEIINDFHMQTARGKLLVKIISDRKELVLQHLQGQAAERTEKLNQNLEREAVVMRIVTIVTLVYLPATFTSTFFSTDVVKYQNQDGGGSEGSNENHKNGSFSSIALERWLQVTLPLTALTLLVAWSTYKMYDTSRDGMTTSERFRDIFNSAKARLTPSFLQSSEQTSADATDNSKWHTARRFIELFSPRHGHTSWAHEKGTILPLNDTRQPDSIP